MDAVAGKRVTVSVEGRELSLSNLDKVLYPDTGFTKGEVIDYYSRVAPVLLPYLVGRPLTVKRYPNGVDAPFFYEKNAARGTPDWVRTVSLPAPGSTKDRDRIDYVVVEELATLVWLANLAAIELHVPQWRVTGRTQRPRTDLVVFDLDPGKPAALSECCEVALLLREVLTTHGLSPVAKTSGSKGMQVSAAVEVSDPEQTSEYAHAVAKQLEQQRPELVVSRMTKLLRPGKVLVDWSQNNPAKTTVAPYSLRARGRPTVSTPVSWEEVKRHKSLSFTAPEVLQRVRDGKDLFAPALDDKRRVRLPAEGATRR
jgi:bifunctional non-homologous end joining protein LigD